jgi:hypothetical protein
MSVIIHRVGPITVWEPMCNAHLAHSVVAALISGTNMYIGSTHSDIWR